MRQINLLFMLGLMAALWSCKGAMGDKTDLSFIDKPVYQDREIAYVPVLPILNQFLKPTNVIVGFDRLFYVVDQGTQEIISFDLSGRELSRFKVPGLVNIAQDRSLDLLAIGTKDTVVTLKGQETTLTLSTVYRINQKNGALYGLQHAKMTPVLIHPYYIPRLNAVESDQEVKFSSIAVLGDNQYYLGRTGTSNSPNQTGGPDNAVLLISAKDEFQTSIAVKTTQGLIRDYFKQPGGLVTLVQPPQLPTLTLKRDFMFTSLSPDLALKVQYIEFAEGQDGADYVVKKLETTDTSKAEGFLYTPDRFSRPSGIAYSGDGTNYIFVVDAEKDSLYQFTNTGLEGVRPPAASVNRKQITASFGGRGIAAGKFNQPSGVAYFERIVYVADAGNGRVLRFKLTSDFD